MSRRLRILWCAVRYGHRWQPEGRAIGIDWEWCQLCDWCRPVRPEGRRNR